MGGFTNITNTKMVNVMYGKTNHRDILALACAARVKTCPKERMDQQALFRFLFSLLLRQLQYFLNRFHYLKKKLSIRQRNVPQLSKGTYQFNVCSNFRGFLCMLFSTRLQLHVLFVDKSQGLFQGHLNMETKSNVDVYVLCIWAGQAKTKKKGTNERVSTF